MNLEQSRCVHWMYILQNCILFLWLLILQVNCIQHVNQGSLDYNIFSEAHISGTLRDGWKKWRWGCEQQQWRVKVTCIHLFGEYDSDVTTNWSRVYSLVQTIAKQFAMETKVSYWTRSGRSQSHFSPLASVWFLENREHPWFDLHWGQTFTLELANWWLCVCAFIIYI